MCLPIQFLDLMDFLIKTAHSLNSLAPVQNDAGSGLENQFISIDLRTKYCKYECVTPDAYAFHKALTAYSNKNRVRNFSSNSSFLIFRHIFVL